MDMFKIESELVDGVVVHSRTLPNGTFVERLSDEGYAEIIRLLCAAESDEAASDFRKAVEKRIEDGKKVQIMFDEMENSRKKLRSIIVEQAKFSSIGMFIASLEAESAIDRSDPFAP